MTNRRPKKGQAQRFDPEEVQRLEARREEAAAARLSKILRGFTVEELSHHKWMAQETRRVEARIEAGQRAGISHVSKVEISRWGVLVKSWRVGPEGVTPALLRCGAQFEC